jgi:hypothetical protein
MMMQTLHLIRHGEGFHNVAGQKDYHAYKSWDFEDAHLTDYGWDQVNGHRSMGILSPSPNLHDSQTCLVLAHQAPVQRCVHHVTRCPRQPTAAMHHSAHA